ncbi:hypothetical protein GCM10023196_038520 [Actinoallomurus vinaceus]|uniref:Uncharacterized protein n=1 Tax=Actinoallomurus vinaceus TaxID=1080074 RepID=A0ABP8U9P9_9ACTN
MVREFRRRTCRRQGAAQQAQEDVRAELLGRTHVTVTPKTGRDGVDPAVRGSGLLRRKVETTEIRGARVGLDEPHAALPLGLLTPARDGVRIPSPDQSAGLRSDLAGGLNGGALENGALDPRDEPGVDLAGAVPERAGLGVVDVADRERRERGGQTIDELGGEPDQITGRRPGEGQRLGDLVMDVLARRDRLEGVRLSGLGEPAPRELCHCRQFGRLRLRYLAQTGRSPPWHAPVTVQPQDPMACSTPTPPALRSNAETRHRLSGGPERPSDADRAVDSFAEEVGVAVVPGVLVDHVQHHQAE